MLQFNIAAELAFMRDKPETAIRMIDCLINHIYNHSNAFAIKVCTLEYI